MSVRTVTFGFVLPDRDHDPSIFTAYKECAITLTLVNTSEHVLSATDRFDPECEPHLDEVLNQESIHCL